MTPTQRAGGEDRSQLFDLSTASAGSWASKRRLVGIVIGLVVLLTLGGVTVLTTTPWGALFAGSLSFFQGFDALVLLGTVVGGLIGSYWLLALQYPSAVELRIDSSGFELTFRRRGQTRRSWSDPKLELQLIDYSRMEPSALATPAFPYSIRVGWARSLLTREAFEAMTEQIQLRGLEEQIIRGSPGASGHDMSPLVHRVSSSTAAKASTGDRV